jgi:hypothetical protein
MSGVFQNIGPPPPSPPGECVPPPFVREEDTLAGWRGGWGVNFFEDARRSSVLYICKYIVVTYQSHISKFVCVCVSDPYLPGRDDTVLKWKPLSMNSVDFRLKVVKGTRRVSLPPPPPHTHPAPFPVSTWLLFEET